MSESVAFGSLRGIRVSSSQHMDVQADILANMPLSIRRIGSEMIAGNYSIAHLCPNQDGHHPELVFGMAAYS